MDSLKNAVDSIIAYYKKWDTKNPEPEKIPIFILTIGVGERRSEGYDQKSTNYDALNSALKYLSINTEAGTKTDTYLTLEDQRRDGYTSLCKMPYVFMLSLDDASKPDLMNVKCNSLEPVPAANFFDKYDDASNLYKKMSPDGEVLCFGISAQISRLTSLESETDMWTKIRKEGNFKSMRGIRDDNPLSELKNTLEKIVSRKGIVLVHNDAWWETPAHPSHIGGRGVMYHASPYLQNAFMESYPWVGGMLWGLTDLSNVWFLSRISDREDRRSGLMKWNNGLKNITALPHKDAYGIDQPAKKGIDIIPGFVPYGPSTKKSPFNELINDPPVPVVMARGRGGKRKTRRRRSHKRRRI